MELNLIVISLIALGVTGLLAALVLYLFARKFRVEEDPRIDVVQELLPGANCGGCGFAGCRALAEACCKSESLDGLLCPVGGSEVMDKIGEVLGMSVEKSDPLVAVVRCNGSCDVREKRSEYDGVKSCKILNSLYVGETGCGFGCLGCGDCVSSCQFDAIHINSLTGLAEVDEEKCVACGSCVKSCPRHIIELRKKGPKSRRVWVDCVNRDKGAVARKNCKNACIGCGKCQKECPFEAITVENNVAYIDWRKCRLCRKCVAVCPTGAIHELNFPVRAQVKEDVKVEVKAEVEVEVKAEVKVENEVKSSDDIKQ